MTIIIQKNSLQSFQATEVQNFLSIERFRNLLRMLLQLQAIVYTGAAGFQPLGNQACSISLLKWQNLEAWCAQNPKEIPMIISN